MGDGGTRSDMKRVALLLFDDVEVLDACGPFEVFATSKSADGHELFEVMTVAEHGRPVCAVGGLLLQPQFTLDECPQADVLIVPGGVGRKREFHNERVIRWIQERALAAELVLSVCTGAFLLAKAGLLEGLDVTTHHSAHEELATGFPTVRVLTAARYVDQGKVVTAAGIAAGIDASLHVVGRLCGNEVAERTAQRMEYVWTGRRGE